MKIRGFVAPLAVILGLAALGAAVPASAAAPPTGAVAVTAAPANSGQLSAGADLTIQVTIDNKTDADLAAGTATVRVGDSTFTTRTSLADWIAGAGNTSLASRTIGSAPTSPIFATQTATVTATVPAASLGFGAAGVYPVSVAVTSGTSTVATSRTAVAWNPSAANPVPIVIAAPLTVPTTGADTGFLTAKTLTTYTAPNGVLTRELNDLAATQVAIGIDPRIIASIRVLGTSAPQSAQDWLDRLAALPNDTFPLAWADADLTIALQAGLATVPAVKPLDYAIDPKLFAATGTVTDTPTPTPTPTGSPVIPTLPTSADLVKWKYTLPQLSWPAENSVSTGDLTKLSAGGYNSLILSSTNITRSVNHTPGGASVAIGSTSDVVSDAILSTYLRDAVGSGSHIEWTAAMTRLITAADQISLETPKGAPAMVATLGRNWINDSLQLPHSLADLYSRPWVGRSTLTDVTRVPAETVKLDSKTEPTARAERVAAMFTAESAEVRFSTIAANPEALTSSRRLILLSLLSNEWKSTSAAWDKASAQFLTDSSKIVSSVQVVDSSAVLLLADQASLPITVSNELDQPVTVYITVRPQTTQLFVDKKHTTVALTLNSEEQRKVQIPVQSVSNGKVRVHVTLFAADGTQVGESKTVQINVQAGWETLGTLIFAALVFATFGFGIVRNILNRRKARSE